MEGLPVDGGLARVLVLNGADGAPDRVVHVGAKLASPPAGGFGPMAVTGPEAVDTMRATQSFRSLTEWSDAELCVFYAEGGVDLEEPVRAWRVSAHNTDMAAHEAYTMFVDAATGELVYVRDDVHHVDVDGNSSGNATPGTLPDTGSNPPVPMALPSQNVGISGGNSSTTDDAGDFTIAHGGSSPVTVNGDLTGPWVRVFTDVGAELTESVNVTPPGPANLFFNSTPSESETAQVNAFIHTNLTHDFFKERQPGFTPIDLSITCNTNLGSTCNAFYSSAEQSINFFSAGGGCVNTAYTSVVAHEYGHFVVNRLGLGQGAFGEGFGDCCGMLLYDDPIVGRDFLGSGTNVRDPLGDNVQYPCGGAIHFCGQVLGASWYRIRQNFGTTYGSTPGLEMSQQLFTDWAMITIGGIGGDSAHPTTAIEVLTVDDDDGNLGNGTPNYGDICDAFAQASIDCPPLPEILFSYPSGLPTTLAPDASTTIDVVVEAGSETPAPDSGTLTFRVNGGSFTTIAMVETSPNVYEATLPAGICFDAFDFYFSVDATGGGTFSDPSDAPASFYSANVVTGAIEIFSDDFQTNQGWTVINEDLSDGPWERGVPAGDGTRGDPLTDADGSGACYLTDNVAGNSDVDGGPTRLISPVIDMSAGDGTVGYAYWMFNDDGDDSLVVEISNDGGASWTTARTYLGGNGGWTNDGFTVSDFVTPSNQVRLRFSVTDNPNDSVTEAALDAVSIMVFECDSFTDCNDNGIPDEDETDCNGNGIPDDCDIDDGFSLDCNGNGVPDECDIASGFSLDCNGNDVPDECDIASGFSLDCNGNDIPDECDIASGFSDDCNGNTVPDECDIASGTSQDCDVNGVPDECDIANGDAEDCNANGVPDECDIAEGTSEDVNGNGIPDECDETITLCGIGATNEGCGPRSDVLTVNGSTGGPGRTLVVTPTTPLSFSLAEPPGESGDGGNERMCMYIWLAAPTESDDIVLPQGLGNMCFGPRLLWTRPADLISNSIGAVNKLGEHDAPGPPVRIPDGGSVEWLSAGAGVGATVQLTVQGFVADACSAGDKPFSVTNGLVIDVQ